MSKPSTELTKDIIQWDIDAWSKALDFWEKQVDWNTVNNALELGGRQGGLSLWLALKDKNVLCSDLKDTENSAQNLHNQYNVSSIVKYQDINAANIPFTEHFDVVIFKSIIGSIGIHDNIEIQQKVFDEIYKALKPGGKLLFAENLSASKIHKHLRKKFVPWAKDWRYVNLEEIHCFLAKFSSYTLQTTGVIGTFGRNEKQRKLLTKIDDLVLNKICPDSWKYIVYGVAEK